MPSAISPAERIEDVAEGPIFARMPASGAPAATAFRCSSEKDFGVMRIRAITATGPKIFAEREYVAVVFKKHDGFSRRILGEPRVLRRVVDGVGNAGPSHYFKADRTCPASSAR